MAKYSKLAAVVLAVLVSLQASCAVARPCGAVESIPPGSTRQKATCRSPAISKLGETPAVMTLNGFQKGETGGGPSECDGQYHSDDEKIAALSTGWYGNGRRCSGTIRITSAQSGRTVEAKVVDECDSRRGCKANIVDTSKAVWEELGLDTSASEVLVTWSDA